MRHYKPLVPIEKHKFKSSAFENGTFVFVAEKAKIVAVISESPNQSIRFKKISNTPDDFNGTDSLLVLKKKTQHFIFLFNELDSARVGQIALMLEQSHDRILADFKIEKILPTTVRIYPTVESFHQGINFPNAPSNILATAFGKDDFRMLSPTINGTDSLELYRHVIHEFTHCVHLNISYSPNNPRWLWEGVAMFECGWFVDPKSIDVLRQKQYPLFSSLQNGLEYELGFVIIEAIKEIWGFDKVVELIKLRGDTKAVLMIDQNEFEKRIYDQIQNKYFR